MDRRRILVRSRALTRQASALSLSAAVSTGSTQGKAAISGDCRCAMAMSERICARPAPAPETKSRHGCESAALAPAPLERDQARVAWASLQQACMGDRCLMRALVTTRPHQVIGPQFADMLSRVRSRCAPEYQDFVREVSFAGPGEAIDFVDALAACPRLVAVAHEGHEREDDPGSMWCIALHGSH